MGDLTPLHSLKYCLQVRGVSRRGSFAEGMERATEKEKARFLDIAKGLCSGRTVCRGHMDVNERPAAELRTQIYIGIDIGYISKETGNQWVRESKELSAMLAGLIKTLKNHTDS